MTSPANPAETILALRPFVPAKDFARSKAFYQALGFRMVRESKDIAIFELGAFGFILQDFYVQELAHNFMIQLMVDDVDAWWRTLDCQALVKTFGAQPPRAPAMQPWGLKVGFIFDPCGPLWHVAEPPA
jgi:catechol 2,3-dioxygenase-like lactoylglutathione lyase family enzyme